MKKPTFDIFALSNDAQLGSRIELNDSATAISSISSACKMGYVTGVVHYENPTQEETLDILGAIAPHDLYESVAKLRTMHYRFAPKGIYRLYPEHDFDICETLRAHKATYGAAAYVVFVGWGSR